MLQLLIDGLKAKKLYFARPLKEIEHSCCQSSEVVIDFDAVKDAYIQQTRYAHPWPKSCDVLLLVPQDNRIIFGEMKDMEKLIERFINGTLEDDKSQEKEPPSPEEILEHLSDKLRNKYRPDKKAIDSVFLLLEIAIYCEVEKELIHFIMSQQCSIACYFVMHFSPERLLLVNDLLKSETAYYHYHKIGSIDFIPASIFDQIIEQS